MIFPPAIFRIRVRGGPKRRRFGCLLPLLALWPVLLAAAILMAIAGLVALPLARSKGRRAFLAGPRLLRLFCALRGLYVDVCSPDSDVLIYVK